ncbi:YitT family protein, partial [Clostridium neonatale]
MKKKPWFKYVVTALAVIISSFLQTYAIKVFVEPAGLLSSGFTGVAILIDRITSLYGKSFSTSLGMIILNVPVAI